MAFKSKNNQVDEEIMAEINMTPLIDIMLVLLIIFMVTSSVSLESGLDINIPKTASKTNKNESKTVIISLDKSGQYSVQGQVVAIEALQESISQALKSTGSTQVILEGDETSTLGKAIEVMDIAKNAGAEKFSIAAAEK